MHGCLQLAPSSRPILRFAPPLLRDLAPLGDVLPHFHLSQHGFTHEGQEDVLAPQEVHDAHHGLVGSA